jgi:hypothetical protein
MATTNYKLAAVLSGQYPNTFKAMQDLVMAMAGYQKNRNRKGIFGKEKGPAAYEKFEVALKGVLVAMKRDGMATAGDSAPNLREKIVATVGMFSVVYPNWQDAYAFSDEFFKRNADVATREIERLLA